MATEKKTTAIKTAPVTDEVVADAVVEKKYGDADLIMCRSIINGGLYAVGERTKFLYQWADYGDEIGVEYQDLIFMIRAHKDEVYEPRFIIEDENIVNKHPEVKKLYDSMYSTRDLKDIIALDVNRMRSVINNLPSGAKNSLKGLISTMIDSGELDSVKKIQALDEIFGTQLILIMPNR